MLKIRLQRTGRKHEPTFRLVLTDSKNATRSGRFKEILGSYDARKSTDAIKSDRVKYWLSMGANPTATVHNLLVTHKILGESKKNVSRSVGKGTVPEVVVTAPAETVAAPVETVTAPAEKESEGAIIETSETTE